MTQSRPSSFAPAGATGVGRCRFTFAPTNLVAGISGRGERAGLKTLVVSRGTEFESDFLQRGVLANLTRSIRSPKILPSGFGSRGPTTVFPGLPKTLDEEGASGRHTIETQRTNS